jgi:hypothetical protein
MEYNGTIKIIIGNEFVETRFALSLRLGKESHFKGLPNRPNKPGITESHAEAWEPVLDILDYYPFILAN